MSNQNLPKLFFFNIEPWKEVYNDRFLLKQLQEKGFPIEYVLSLIHISEPTRP